jgi:hypothetical protein
MSIRMGVNVKGRVRKRGVKRLRYERAYLRGTAAT